jgi:hypothetical protein
MANRIYLPGTVYYRRKPGGVLKTVAVKKPKRASPKKPKQPSIFWPFTGKR